MPRKALGKGLDALFTQDETEVQVPEREAARGRRIMSVALGDLVPNASQPREHFSDDSLEELKQSIKENGILEPPVVRRKGDFFEIIAGERRYRAARELGLDSIDVIVMDEVTDDQVLVLSLIENIQRENLNALEEARAYRQIMEKMDLTQEGLSAVVGKSRSTIANTLRLLSLSERVQNLVFNGELAPGSARPLITVEDHDLQYRLARKIADNGMSARQAEDLVKKSLNPALKKKTAQSLPPIVEEVRADIQRRFGTAVMIRGSEKRGKIEIPYNTMSELEDILEILKGDSLE